MFKIVYRYIMRNKKYSIGAIIGIAISTMLMFSMIQISDSYMSSFRSFVNSGAPQDFYVIDLSYEELTAINERFRRMGEEAPDRYLSTILVGNMYYDNSKASVVMGYEGDLEYFKKTSLLSGKYPDSDNEVCIEESYTQLHPELNIGDEMILDITLTNEEEEKDADADDNEPVDISRKFTVCGIIKDVADNGNFFYTDLKTAESIFAENNLNCSKSNAIIVEAKEGNYHDEKIVNAIEEIKNIVVDDTVEGRKYFNSVQLIYNDEKTENYADKGSFESTALTVFLLSLIIAVCLTIFVYNSISLSFVRKINVFGTMRCIGLNHKQLIRFILTEQLILVSIGTFIGIASGALLNLAIAEKIMAALFSTAAVMKVEQSIKTYFVTYLLTILSAFIACLKLILRIRKTNPINIREFHASKKIFSKNTRNFTSKNLLFHIALRNLKRNSAKSVIQTVTLVVSFMLCLVICNFFAVIGINSVKGAVDFSDYSIQADITDITNDHRYFSEEDLELLRSMDHIEKIYTEKCPIDYVWDKKDSSIQVLIYDDDLWQKFAEINDIKYDSSQPFSVLISETAYEDETFSIHSTESNHKFTVKPNVRLSNASKLSYAVFSQENTLIVNEKLAESKGIDIGYCAFLVDTDNIMSELLDIPFSIETVYVTNLHDGQSNAESQLLGMIVVAIYIVIATVILSFMIISNTIKENMASKKAEYGVMRAMGLSLKNLWTVACHENLILTLIAVAVSIPISLIVNAYLSLILFQQIKISILAYLLVNLILIGLIELFAYCNIKTSTNDSIVEMIYER
ncbi:MAG: FtsX-like permease family protein [Oscillospiraceae bacterium]|nr:FtsX-like permease family protein [Oscillospiraceae bacterium]